MTKTATSANHRDLPACASHSLLRESPRDMIADASAGRNYAIGACTLGDSHAEEAIDHGCLTISWGRVKITPKGKLVASRVRRSRKTLDI